MLQSVVLRSHFGSKKKILLRSLLTLLSFIVVSQNSTVHCVYLGTFFSTGLVRGILSRVAVDEGGNIA